MTPDQLQARAFEIADQAMYELLVCHGIPDEAAAIGGSGGVFLVSSDSLEVTALCDSDPAIQEAYEWLHARGLAEIRTDSNGEFIFLKGME